MNTISYVICTECKQNVKLAVRVSGNSFGHGSPVHATLCLPCLRKALGLASAQLAEEFIAAHQGIGYQSESQMAAVRAFAEWMSQRSV